MRIWFSALLLTVAAFLLVSCDADEQPAAPEVTATVRTEETSAEVAAATATITRTPFPTRQPLPSPSPTAQPSATPEMTATPASTEAAQATATVEPTATSEAADAAESEATAEPTATAEATATPDGEASPSFSAQAAQRGQQVFLEQGCNTCHPGGQGGTGPSLIGIFGEEVELESGETVTVDQEYLRRSILHPSEQIVAGYQDLMPSFSDLDDRQVRQLIAYIRSLGE